LLFFRIVRSSIWAVNLLSPGTYKDAYDPTSELIRRWNIDSPATDQAMQKLSTIDDVGFTEALIDYFAENFKIDESRVYATGMYGAGFSPTIWVFT
jgi:hypothetical protein